mmetsp:Transcript_11223/g.33654  ORF Transcript_11223/g.33654 Transcript_11223/m.33654 type:complete len:314 (-) Transcript_11223:768-1709(-)
MSSHVFLAQNLVGSPAKESDVVVAGDGLEGGEVVVAGEGAGVGGGDAEGREALERGSGAVEDATDDGAGSEEASGRLVEEDGVEGGRGEGDGGVRLEGVDEADELFLVEDEVRQVREGAAAGDVGLAERHGADDDGLGGGVLGVVEVGLERDPVPRSDVDPLARIEVVPRRPHVHVQRRPLRLLRQPLAHHVHGARAGAPQFQPRRQEARVVVVQHVARRRRHHDVFFRGPQPLRSTSAAGDGVAVGHVVLFGGVTFVVGVSVPPARRQSRRRRRSVVLAVERRRRNAGALAPVRDGSVFFLRRRRRRRRRRR